ncbi:trimeric intracellular cation channel family protein [Microbulbifer agarilyticus]|uniref:trimeric intracellular cation channel family protein n=1 Tax=Microbulbifer agarilyticus TaxID=260552 RepID=UPI001CD48EFA|nr:trimeric intracellular cation channel family protein [Microbulbifer agarilyticus]MCA0901020.1 trimeric intracellular cation channel family protein [Microbulbifer agarilyticus]
MTVAELQYALGMAGTVAFAATAVAAVAPKRIDLFGALVMGVITSIGGGTVRDLILGVPVFWSEDLNYIWVALAASLLAFIANKRMTGRQVYRAMLYLDAAGVALFAIQAVEKTMDLSFALPLGPILLGIITAIGGGLLRDVLAGNETLLMRKELYAVPVTLGCITYIGLLAMFPGAALTIGAVSMLLIFCLRSAAIYWHLSVPDSLLSRPGDSKETEK